jgi:hypothetical protein
MCQPGEQDGEGCSCNPASPEALLCVCMDWGKLWSATRSCGGGDVAAEGGEARESGGALLAGRGKLFHFYVRMKGTRHQAFSRAPQTPEANLPGPE